MNRIALIVSIAIFVAGGFGNYLRFSERRPDRAPDFSQIPLTSETYFGDERRFSEESYEVLQADTTTLRYYRTAGGQSHWLFIAYFSSQKYGSQIHSPKHCLPGGGWVIESLEPYQMQFPDGSTRDVNRLVIAEREKRQLMFYWFETRGGVIRNEFALKWDLMQNSLLLRPTDAAIIRLTVPMERGASLEKTTEAALTFLREFAPAISTSLPFPATS